MMSDFDKFQGIEQYNYNLGLQAVQIQAAKHCD
jgi:hypothetical protein